MLKEENMQLSTKLSAAEVTAGTPHQQRVSQLEQTVLTLRGTAILKGKSNASYSFFIKRREHRGNIGKITDSIPSGDVVLIYFIGLG